MIFCGPYHEIYIAYMRNRNRKTVKEAEIMEGVATLMRLEGLTLMQLRMKAYKEIYNE